MIEVIGKQLRNRSEVRGGGLWNQNTAEGDIVMSRRLTVGVSVHSTTQRKESTK